MSSDKCLNMLDTLLVSLVYEHDAESVNVYTRRRLDTAGRLKMRSAVRMRGAESGVEGDWAAASSRQPPQS